MSPGGTTVFSVGLEIFGRMTSRGLELVRFSDRHALIWAH